MIDAVEAERTPIDWDTGDCQACAFRTCILHRYLDNLEGRDMPRLVVPKELRAKIMTMVRAGLSGEQSTKKIQDRIANEFWRPTRDTDVKTYCRIYDTGYLTRCHQLFGGI